MADDPKSAAPALPDLATHGLWALAAPASTHTPQRYLSYDTVLRRPLFQPARHAAPSHGRCAAAAMEAAHGG